jgi:hypothetical protein
MVAYAVPVVVVVVLLIVGVIGWALDRTG